MSSECSNPVDAARQLLLIEQLFGSADFMARPEVNALPEVSVSAPTGAAGRGTSGFSRGGAADFAVGGSSSVGSVKFTPAESLPAQPRDLSPAKKAELLAAMDRDEVKVCRKCGLAQTRTNTVFGEVNPNADLVFVGEAPGADEDLTGRPFVGRAGELLTKMIGAMGLSRDDVFICNTLKCRPPGNRNPAPEESAACFNYLLRQLQILQPKVIVALGNPATRGLLKTREGITRLRGVWQKLPDLAPGLEGIPVMPTFHPAYLLRNYSVEARGKVWSDLRKVMDLLGLQIPEKK